MIREFVNSPLPSSPSSSTSPSSQDILDRLGLVLDEIRCLNIDLEDSFTTPTVDALLNFLKAEAGVLGANLIGAGNGGYLVAVVSSSRWFPNFKPELEPRLQQRFPEMNIASLELIQEKTA